MQLNDFDYELPPELIAQRPLETRSSSRLLLLSRARQTITHHQFVELPAMLREGDLLVRNETKVLPARLLGSKQSGGQVEVLLLRQHDTENNIWRCMTRSSRALKPGTLIDFPAEMTGEVVEAVDGGQRMVRFSSPASFLETLEQVGHVPLPPYIRRDDQPFDKDRYQTVYASNPGAVAAPTAGLHFTEETFADLTARDIEVCGVTLHVGPGTFLPVRSENLQAHRMHAEAYDIPFQAAERINNARAEGRRIIALGTTVTRTLEHAVDANGLLQAGQGETDLFIKPGHSFRMVDALVTNFHLPKSTLVVLVSAFAGREFILRAYRTAVAQSYRFFSYGDCMLIE
ncbi:MAG: tRNA preQ1(34) S-adenosylmethionine ribosyltransferase-isomerase QueA [Desulfuromonadales bacterium]|jgi:S-adenosylmethionine:tRNA ribosyltransferase-isomerase